MRFEDFKYRLPARQWSKMKPQTLKVWRFAVEWIVEQGESDCFDDEALEAIKDELGMQITKQRWVSHLRAMERAGLVQGHRIVISLEFANFGGDFLRGVCPGAYIAYTLPGMIALGKEQAFLVAERVRRKPARSRQSSCLRKRSLRREGR